MENADSGLFFKMQNARPSFLYTRDLLMVVVFAVVLVALVGSAIVVATQKYNTKVGYNALFASSKKKSLLSLKVDNEKSEERDGDPQADQGKEGQICLC